MLSHSLVVVVSLSLVVIVAAAVIIACQMCWLPSPVSGCSFVSAQDILVSLKFPVSCASVCMYVCMHGCVCV